jgi:leucyl aminopeptidase
VGDKPWAHLDIAGPAWNTGGPWGHVPSGGTGYAIATLVAYAAALADPTGEPAVAEQTA